MSSIFYIPKVGDFLYLTKPFILNLNLVEFSGIISLAKALKEEDINLKDYLFLADKLSSRHYPKKLVEELLPVLPEEERLQVLELAEGRNGSHRFFYIYSYICQKFPHIEVTINLPSGKCWSTTVTKYNNTIRNYISKLLPKIDNDFREKYNNQYIFPVNTIFKIKRILIRDRDPYGIDISAILPGNKQKITNISILSNRFSDIHYDREMSIALKDI